MKTAFGQLHGEPMKMTDQRMCLLGQLMTWWNAGDGMCCCTLHYEALKRCAVWFIIWCVDSVQTQEHRCCPLQNTTVGDYGTAKEFNNNVFFFFSRHEDKLEPKFNFEGHQLGVVSVDINSAGTRIHFYHIHTQIWYMRLVWQASRDTCKKSTLSVV